MDPGGELNGKRNGELSRKQRGKVMEGYRLLLREQLYDFLNEQLHQIVISNPRDKEEAQKIKVRPLYLRLPAGKDAGDAGLAADESLAFQAEEFRGKQAFHRNMRKEETLAYIEEAMQKYKQLELQSELGSMQVLVSKAGKQTVKVKKAQPVREAAGPESAEPQTAGKQTVKVKKARPERRVAGPENAGPQTAGKQTERAQPKMRTLTHNRRKRYILEEGRPVPFLKDLGVMTAEGKIVNSRYDKFRQINRFLEFIEDVLPQLPKDREVRIIDFGCGKSYLTFAMYYYLHELQGLDVRITGLDLKEDVIEHCGQLARQYGYEKLEFLHGDIANYAGADRVDMVVTLYACDTATDYALAKAVGWNAKVILSVPCCQHELNGQMENDLLKSIFHYGIVKERMAALYTDALRAEILENHGYRTQILEFIDMEHTPKNLLLRCVRSGRRKDNCGQIKAVTEFLGVEPTLLKLLGTE